MKKNNRIDSLQGLRFIAFLFIFIWHLNGYMGIASINLAHVAVSFFFMLSGFVSILGIEKYIKKNENIIDNSFEYAKLKFSKIYKLYLIVIILYAPISFKHLVLDKGISIVSYIMFFFLNVFLVQSWIPKNLNSISHAGWYLSNLLFLDLITIPVYKFLNYINKKNLIRINIFVSVFVLGLLYIYCMIVPNNGYWLYYCPLYGMFQYIIGMCVARIYEEFKKYSLKEPLATIFETVIFIISLVLISEVRRFDDGFTITLIFIIINSMIIFYSSLLKGYISKFLSNKYLVSLGNVSDKMYLIHILTISYYLSFISKCLPVNIVSIVFAIISTLALTVLLSYVYSWYEKGKLKDKLIRLIGIFKKMRFKCTDFTIISNNCFAGIIYRNNNIPYQSPTCGLFIMPDDYIKFIKNIKKYLSKDMKQISIDDSKYKEYLLKINYGGTIGKIDDIEVMFLHYKDFNEAKEKWYKRAKRINYDKIIFKFSDQNNCSLKNLKDFQKFQADNKILFTAKKYDGIDSIIFDEFKNDGYVKNDTKEKIFKKYFNVYDYVNKRFG